MKKIMIYTSVIGLAMGVAVYLLSKKCKSKDSKKQRFDNESDDLTPNTSEQESAYISIVADETIDVKSSSAHSIHDRHTEAADIMCNAFENIYKDIETVEDDEKKTDPCVIDSMITNNELDSISDELDNLLE